MNKLVKGPLFQIKVKFVTERTIRKHVRHTKTESVRGLFDSAKNLILVDKTLAAEELRHTLLHEMVHAAEFQLSGQEEEARVDAMARWIGDILSDGEAGLLC